MASALCCCSLSRGFQRRRRRRRLRHPLAFLCGMKFEWGSERIKTWDSWVGKGGTCSTGYRALDALMRVARGNSCRQRISVIEYDKFCFTYFILFFHFWQNCKIRLSKGLCALCVTCERGVACVAPTEEGGCRKGWLDTHVRYHQKGCIKFPSKWLWKRHLAKGHTRQPMEGSAYRYEYILL